MSDQYSFLTRIRAGEALISDGAMGTNLQERGLPHGVAAESWLFDQPEQVIALHHDFVQAGSDIILTNTFGGGPLRLKEAGLEGTVREVNHLAVELARKAAGDRPVLVGGSMGPIGKLVKPYGPLEPEEVSEHYAQQANALTGAGVDLLALETQFDLTEASLGVKAIRSVSSLPLVCSFSYDRGTRSMMGVNASQMAAAFADMGVDILGINCGKSLEDNLQALKELKTVTSLPIWFKPNAGLPELDKDYLTVYQLKPEEMGVLAPSWIAAGAQIIGGCCGTTPAHLAEIARKARS